MRILNVLMSDCRYSFSHVIIDYLNDAGHLVHQYDVAQVDYDFLIDFDENTLNYPQLIFTAHALKNESVCIKVGLIKNNGYCELVEARYCLTELTSINSHLESLFIEAIVQWMRMANEVVAFMPYEADLESIEAFKSVLSYEAQLTNLAEYYQTFSGAIQLKLPDDSTEEKAFIKIDTSKFKPNREQIELFLIYILAQLNAREEGVYCYDLQSKNKKITKYIKLTGDIDYSALHALIHHPCYDICSDPLYAHPDFEENQPEALLVFSHLTTVQSYYPLTFYFNEKTSCLNIGYPRTCHFFSNCFEFTLDFFKHYFSFAKHDITFDAYLSEPDTPYYNQLISWNKTNKAFPCKLIHQLFEEQVKSTPNQIAVVLGDRQLSYHVLNEEANQLAHFIRKHYDNKLEPDTLIAICMESSLEFLIALLGVLKSGAAYVPIDLSDSVARVEYILNDTGATLVLDDTFFDNKPYLNEAAGNLTPLNTPQDLAYVIYTSGTTGKPKGVMVEHASVVNASINCIERLNITQTSRVSQFLSIGFDASYSEIFPALFSGATLYIVPKSVKYSHHFGQYLFQNRITVLTTPPHLLGEQKAEDLKYVQSIHTGGSQANTYLYETWHAGRILVNAYGPTEASIATTMFQYKAGASSAVIGQPLNNVQVYVLDQKKRLLPIGVVGELYIGGVGVARGYLNEPELTDARFSLNSFMNDGSLMYQTGDFARWLADGNLEYIGRNDFQVKINSYRVELGEIEHVLDAHPQVHRSVAMAYDGKLVGYYVGEAEDLESYLSENLPQYMVPKVLIRMETFALTASGKVERKKLPKPGFLVNRASYVGPRDEREHAVCCIWQNAFQIQSVGILDDFFQLGGHSILAIQLAHKMSRILKCNVLISDIIKYKTISAICVGLRHGENLALIEATDSQETIFSYAQDRLWFIEQYEKGARAYHIPVRITLEPNMNEARLTVALQAVVARHSILRTCFQMDERGAYRQVVQDKLLVVQDNINATQFIECHFDLMTDYPVRAGFFNDKKQRYLLVVFHHIAFDEWSATIFGKELWAFYHQKEMPKLEVQYKDFSVWQRQRVEPRLEALSTYWQTTLEDFIPLELQTDYSRPAHFDYRGAVLTFDLPKTYLDLSQQYNSTPYTVFLTALAVTLSHYTGQLDFPIGTLVANRQHPQLESLIGFFVNTLVLRMELGATDTLDYCVKKTQEKVLEAQLNQDFPFEKLLHVLGIEREPSRHPIFQVLYVMQYPDEELTASNLTVLEPEVAKFDLTFTVKVSTSGIKLHIEYATSLFKQDSIEKFATYYQQILQTMLNDQNTSLDKSSILSPDEYHQQVYGWNETHQPYPEQTIHGLFEAQASRTPNHMALVFEEQSLTYRALNAESNQLARYLREHYDIKPDTLIAVQMARSLDLVVALLGVLKSGGAYVPIDLNTPEVRMAYILDDTKAVLVLDDKFFEKKPYLDKSTRNLTPVSMPSNLAYVIYTSGTTGTPKGVMVEHKRVARLFDATDELFHFNETDVWTLYHAFVFDFSVWEIFGALLYGGKLVIPTCADIRDAHQFHQLCQRHQVTVLNQTPSAYQAALDGGFSETLRYIILGGEALPTFIPPPHDQTQVINMYGITENTVHTTYYLLKKHQQVLMGKQLPDLKLYVLNAQLNPLPTGAIGELYISGAGLARGYLNQPELTAERFIINPFLNDGSLMYKTGDLVKRLADGNLEYIGRNDTQVKIRGHRIECSEIEHVLNTHPSVHQSVVIAHEGKLLGYYVGEAENLESYLSQKLPSYMLPSVLMPMDSFPLTTSGKLNRGALPLPDWKELAENYVAPRNALESKLCDIWQEELNVERVGIEDNFFRLGGDSILSIRLVGRMKQNNLNVAVKDLYLHKTIAKILTCVEQVAEPEARYQAFSLISPEIVTEISKKEVNACGSIEDIYPASHLQMGMFVDEIKHPRPGLYLDSYFFKIKEVLDMARLRNVIGQLVQRHPLLRTSFIKHEQYGYLSVQWDSLAIDDHFHHIQASFVPEAFIDTRMHQKFQAHHPGLFEIFVYTMPDAFILGFSMHHVIMDGWSIATFITEFLTAYLTKQNVLQTTIPHYAEFIVKEKEALNSKKNEQFWKTYLSDHKYSNKNFIFNANKVSKKSYVTCSHEVTQVDSLAVIHLSKKLSISPDIVFLSLYALVLSRFYATSSVVIGLSVNNRPEQVGGDGIFGLHLNTLPLKIEVTPEDYVDLVGFLQKVSVEKTKLMPYKRYPYAKIKALSTASESDLYRCSFNYIHFHIVEPIIASTDLEKGGSIDYTSIPLAFHAQRFNNKFVLKLDGHNDFIDQETGEQVFHYLAHYLKHLLQGEFEDNSFLPQKAYQHLMKLSGVLEQSSESKTIHQLFEAQVKKTPDEIAVRFSHQTLTYSALNQQANQLAQCIRKQLKGQLTSDTLIAVCFYPSLEMVISLLAVLKAGGAYLPIDPNYPEERMTHMLQDSASPLLLTQIELLVYLQHVVPSELFIVDQSLYQYESADDLASINTSHDLAYVIYTSGTTGNAKGVMIEHAGVVNYLTAQKQYLKPKTGENIYLMHSFAFDTSVSSIWGALLNGCTLVVGDAEEKLSRNNYRDNKIDIAYIPPGFLNTLTKDELSSLRAAVVSGEVFENKNSSQFDSKTQLINEYGVTECTVGSTYHLLSKTTAHGMTIGRPIKNTSMYVLDEMLLPVAMGAIGELYIGGMGVARGYLNQPELTDARFILNPFLNDGSRMYQTGDLVRWQPDGHLAYVGRNDFQINIRGYRIEPSEIEQALNTHPLVQQNVVLAHDNKLVAYYVGEAKHLEDYLDDKLAHYMVPSLFVQLEAFPLTVNGKLDRQALPLPHWEASCSQYVAPRDEKERLVCQVWQEALQISSIGVEDDFFEIGGHSILAVQIAHKLTLLLKREISVAELLKSRTIARLCVLLNESGDLKKIPLYSGNRAPLSYAQERLWFIEQYEEGISPYHVVLKFEYSPDLLVSLQRIVERHEVLRTRFVLDELGTYQEVHEAALPIEDVLNPEEFVQRKFDLTSGHPLRAGLYEGDLLLVIHHIAFDGWSMERLRQELLGDAVPLEIQYKDFAAWQRLEVERSWDKLKAYWVEKLSGIETLALPTDYPRPSRIDYRGASKTFDLPFEIQSFSQCNQTTPYTIMLTALGILLSRYAGQNDIVIGTPIANRQHPQLASLIGFFVNTLVVRLSIEETSLLEMLGRVQSDLIEAQSYQDMPFEKLVDVLDVPRDTSRHPIFQVMYNVEHGTEASVEELVVYETAKFDLNISILVTPTAIRGHIQYATSLFKEETIERLIGHYQTLLSEILSAPEHSISQYSVLTPDEYHQQVYGWNETDKPYPNQTIHSLFEAQVKRTPNHTALIFEEQSLTYQTLNAESNQLARYLRKHCDIKPDTLIAVHMGRGLELIVALLGILKSGAAYVPIDLNYPTARVNYILKDTKAALVLDAAFFEKKPYLDEPTRNLMPISTPNNLAYVIYTSGTTGKPKGVMVEHKGVNNYLAFRAARYQLDEEAVVLQKTPYQFDVSVWELFGTLQTGARLVIAKPDGHQDSDYLRQLMFEHEITHIHFVPSMLSAFMQATSRLPESLRFIFCSGEALSMSAVQAAYEQGSSHLEIHNLYGPTEASIDVTAYACPRGAALVVIGEPIQNIQLYVLDKHLNPLPIGAIGELYISGAGVARGYLNQPELTAERFILNSFLDDGSRMYQTGDLVRRLADGNLEYVGRNDTQIKVRGYRIELSEIEHALNMHPLIQQSVVVAYNEKLVGYYVGETEGLEGYLEEKLPCHMVPSLLMQMDRFPLTQHGKLDKSALPLPDWTENRTCYVAPRNEIESLVCQIWEEVLQVSLLGIEDDFFELGGHSILATQVVHRISSSFKRSLLVAELFQHRTVRKLCEALKHKESLTEIALTSSSCSPSFDEVPVLTD